MEFCTLSMHNAENLNGATWEPYLPPLPTASSSIFLSESSTVCYRILSLKSAGNACTEDSLAYEFMSLQTKLVVVTSVDNVRSNKDVTKISGISVGKAVI